MCKKYSIKNENEKEKILNLVTDLVKERSKWIERKTDENICHIRHSRLS